MFPLSHSSDMSQCEQLVLKVFSPTVPPVYALAVRVPGCGFVLRLSVLGEYLFSDGVNLSIGRAITAPRKSSGKPDRVSAAIGLRFTLPKAYCGKRCIY